MEFCETRVSNAFAFAIAGERSDSRERSVCLGAKPSRIHDFRKSLTRRKPSRRPLHASSTDLSSAVLRNVATSLSRAVLAARNWRQRREFSRATRGRRYSDRHRTFRRVHRRGRRYAASFYENSELNGNHRDYIARDLVTHIDNNYRTIADRDSRGVAGHSTGGYGAILFGMKEADVFGAAYSFSGGGLCFTRPECATYLGGEVAKFNEGFRNWGPGLAPFESEGEALTAVLEPGDVTSLLQREMYSMASAYSPNLANEPMLVDLPWETPSLDIVPEVRDRWFEHDVFVMLPQYADELKSLRGFAFDVGEQDEFGLAGEAISFHEALLEAEVPHEFTLYQGRHGNKLNQRLGHALAFFSDRLLIPEIAVCDFNESGLCDVADLSNDSLFSVDLSIGSTRALDVQRYDLTQDFVVNQSDLDAWLALAAESQGFAEPFVSGDTDLDGDVDFIDFLAFSRGFDRDTRDWSEGNFTGDSDARFEDFLALSANFGTRLERKSIESVPEPNCNWLMTLLFVAGISRRALAPVWNRLAIHNRG